MVLGTDSRQSFLLYDYGSGIMKWGDDVQWENHPILLGYSTGSSQGSLVKASDIYRPDLDSNVGKTNKGGSVFLTVRKIFLTCKTSQQFIVRSESIVDKHTVKSL